MAAEMETLKSRLLQPYDARLQWLRRAAEEYLAGIEDATSDEVRRFYEEHLVSNQQQQQQCERYRAGASDELLI